LHAPVPNKKTALGIVKHAKQDIVTLIKRCHSEADATRATLIGTALESMSKLQQAELNRLQTLAKVNPNIRAEEIEHLQHTIAELAQHIEQAQLSLDMVRVIICT